MVRLEVNARIRDEEEAFDLDQWQDLLDVELSSELGNLADIFQATLVKLDLLVGHDSTCHVNLGCVVEALGHPGQNLLHLLILIVERVTLRHVSREK